MMRPSLKPMLAYSSTPKAMSTAGKQCEAKLDGWRVVAEVDERGKAHIYGGRNTVEYTGQLPYIEKELLHLLPPDTAIDGEVVGPDGWGDVQSVMTAKSTVGLPELYYVVFDITRLCTRDIRKATLKQRRDALDDSGVFPFHECEHIDLIPCKRGKFAALNYHEAAIQGGAEGTVWKRLDSPYTSGARPVPGWEKWKYETSEEALVTGFKPGEGEFKGMVGAVEFQLIEGGIASRCSGMDLTTRRDMTNNPHDWLGTIIEVKHNGRMKSGAPRHPQFLRRRDDRFAVPHSRDPANEFRATRANVSRARASVSKRWMRNYGAMTVGKLLNCKAELEQQSGDAYERVIDRGGDLVEHLAAAQRAAEKKGVG